MLQRIRGWARTLKRESLALWFAARDPRTPWGARALALFTVAYALSPIDLIPDFIPVLGLLDDALLLPALIWLTLRLLPPAVMADSRARATRWLEEGHGQPASRVGAAVIVLLWIAAAAWLWHAFVRHS